MGLDNPYPAYEMYVCCAATSTKFLSHSAIKDIHHSCRASIKMRYFSLAEFINIH
jgi:hypothetical protein